MTAVSVSDTSPSSELGVRVWITYSTIALCLSLLALHLHTGSVKRSIETKGRARGSQMSGASGHTAYRLKVLFAVEGSFLDLEVAIGKNIGVRHLGRSAPSDLSRQKAP